MTLRMNTDALIEFGVAMSHSLSDGSFNHNRVRSVLSDLRAVGGHDDIIDDCARVLARHSQVNAEGQELIRYVADAALRVLNMESSLIGGLFSPPSNSEQLGQLRALAMFRPATNPTSGFDGGQYENLELSGPLFVGRPDAGDISQGSIGTCAILASLITIAADDPSIIENMIRELPDGNFLVTFSDGQSVVVDRSVIAVGGVPISAQVASDGAIWPVIIEKAAVQVMDRSYAEANQGGMPSSAFELLLGDGVDLVTFADPNANSYSLNGRYPYSRDDRDLPANVIFAPHGLGAVAGRGYAVGVTSVAQDALPTIHELDQNHDSAVGSFVVNAWENGFHAITLGTGVGGSDRTAEELAEQGIAAPHAYAVINVETQDDETFITIVNPWGFGVPIAYADTTLPGVPGSFVVPLDELDRVFSAGTAISVGMTEIG